MRVYQENTKESQTEKNQIQASKQAQMQKLNDSQMLAKEQQIRLKIHQATERRNQNF